MMKMASTAAMKMAAHAVAGGAVESFSIFLKETEKGVESVRQHLVEESGSRVSIFLSMNVSLYRSLSRPQKASNCSSGLSS